MTRTIAANWAKTVCGLVLVAGWALLAAATPAARAQAAVALPAAAELVDPNDANAPVERADEVFGDSLRQSRPRLITPQTGGAAQRDDAAAESDNRVGRFVDGTLDAAGKAARRLEASGVSPWPDLSRSTEIWFAVVLTLALLLQFRPFGTARNLDVLMIAATCLLLALRTDQTEVSPGRGSLQWWSYLLLSIAAGYWLIRGLAYFWSRGTTAAKPAMTEGGLSILVLAGLLLGVYTIATAPIMPDSRDGIVGGLYMADTGKLPYGQVGDYDARDPILYLAHAGAVRLIEPTHYRDTDMTADDAHLDQLDASLAMSWSNRRDWLAGEWWTDADLAAARLVNGVAFVLMLLGLFVIGRRLHSPAMGLTLVTVFCVFPGTIECLNQPGILIASTLLTWSVAFALLPVGGLLGTFLLVFAGMAWPWAWLGLPLFLAYFFRRGWHAVGAAFGLIAGVAAVLAGLTFLVAPAPARTNGALAAAGLAPPNVARVEGDTITIAPAEQIVPVQGDLKARLWQTLVNADNLRISPPSGDAESKRVVVTGDVLYRDVDIEGPARTALAPQYAAAAESLPPAQRGAIAIRQVLESTWRPTQNPAHWLESPWSLWETHSKFDADRWVMFRRATKLAVGVITLVLALVTLIGATIGVQRLLGGMLAITAMTLLASWDGAVTNLIWVLPMALATFAVAIPIQPKPPQKTRVPTPPTPRGGRPITAPAPERPATPVFTKPPTGGPANPNPAVPPTSSTPGERAPAPRISVDD